MSYENPIVLDSAIIEDTLFDIYRFFTLSAWNDANRIKRLFSLALSLLMALILRADAHYFAFSFDNLAIFTHRLNRWSYFHNLFLRLFYDARRSVLAAPNDSAFS